MRTPLPPLNWFRAFEASARHLSFTAAGAEIGMTQSAVSQQIKGLESKLRVTLFERRGRGLALTDEGRTLLPQVEDALGKLATALDRVEGPKGQSVLTVRASSSVIEWILAPALPAFCAANPGLSLRFQTAIWSDQFHGAPADVEIRFGSAKQVGQGAQLVLPNRLAAVKAPTLDRALAALPLIEAVGISDGWDKWATAARLPALSPTVFVDSYGLALRLALEGAGVALVNLALARTALDRGHLTLAHDCIIPSNEGFYLFVSEQPPQAAIFAAWLTGLVSGAAPYTSGVGP